MLEKSFNKVKRENPYWSDIICFNNTLIGRNFKKGEINKMFRKLVSRDDYEKKDLEKVLAFCYSL